MDEKIKINKIKVEPNKNGEYDKEKIYNYAIDYGADYLPSKFDDMTFVLKYLILKI